MTSTAKSPALIGETLTVTIVIGDDAQIPLPVSVLSLIHSPKEFARWTLLEAGSNTIVKFALEQIH